MSAHVQHWWILWIAVLWLAGCTPTQEPITAPTPTVIVLDITPAARPVVPAVIACDAALTNLHVNLEERYAPESRSGLLIRLGEPENPSSFLAQIAADELAVVMHPDNPATSLTPSEIQAVFSGQVTNWAEYNGSDTSVQVWVPIPVDEIRIQFDSQVMQGVPIVSDARLAPDPEIMQTVVGSDPGAIGILPASWQASSLHRILTGVRLPVLVVSSQPPQGLAAELVACLQGEIGQQALQEMYSQ